MVINSIFLKNRQHLLNISKYISKSAQHTFLFRYSIAFHIRTFSQIKKKNSNSFSPLFCSMILATEAQSPLSALSMNFLSVLVRILSWKIFSTGVVQENRKLKSFLENIRHKTYFTSRGDFRRYEL